MYAGTDTRDAYYAGWNSSYETIAPRDYQRFLDINRGELLAKTKIKGDKILAQSGKEYEAPEKLSINISAKERSDKERLA